jgi:L-ascorbate metabolism protein UlaG (beta-lactamase superfamily)
MDITYLGHSSFKLKGRLSSVITDPFDPVMVGIKYPRNEADIVTISHNHDDHNKSELILGKKMVITTAGEYEIMGISIIGLEVDHDVSGGEERGKNVIYIFEIDGIRLAHLGDLGHKLTDKTIEQVGDIDVLMLPVGGEYTIGPKDAVDVAKEFSPPYIIPMHYKVNGINEKIFGKLAGVEDFLKESGYDVERLDKLSIKKDLINYETSKVVILEKR